MRKRFFYITLLCMVLPHGIAMAQDIAEASELSLEDCRQMAISSSKELDQARTKVEMAGYDRKIARSYYFPEVSLKGAYLYSNRDISLISDDQSALLNNAGSLLQQQLDGAFTAAGAQLGTAMTAKMTELMTAIQTNPALAAEYMSSPMWQTVMKALQGMDPSALVGSAPNIAGSVNAIGSEIDKALHPDMHNILIGAAVVKQPVFMGGKIIGSNQIADLAEQLARSGYDKEYADIITDVDQAYWQIVSISGKKRLAEAYADLLHTMLKDVEASIEEGVATEADALQIKVKANEADMLLTKATNGLELSKMLLCKKIGLPLDSTISLKDEGMDIIPEPQPFSGKSMEDIFRDRPETRSLELAEAIYGKKAVVARADMMPNVALMGTYLLSNPNLFNGFSNGWRGGMFSAGVMVNIPIFHGCKALNTYRKAQAEQKLYADQHEDAKQMITLQVSQQRKTMAEAVEKLQMYRSSLDSAEENLRTAMTGFEEGVVPATTVLAAQTAWLSANSECIDAGIELQVAASLLEKAEGRIKDNNE